MTTTQGITIKNGWNESAQKCLVHNAGLRLATSLFNHYAFLSWDLLKPASGIRFFLFFCRVVLCLFFVTLFFSTLFYPKLLKRKLHPPPITNNVNVFLIGSTSYYSLRFLMSWHVVSMCFSLTDMFHYLKLSERTQILYFVFK